MKLLFLATLLMSVACEITVKTEPIEEDVVEALPLPDDEAAAVEDPGVEPGPDIDPEIDPNEDPVVDTDDGDAPYNLGTLPSSLSINWPINPNITRDVVANNQSELQEALSTAGTRVRLRASVAGNVEIRASDIELNVDVGVTLRRLNILKGLSRIKINGGQFESISLSTPETYYPSYEIREEWMITDVTVQNATVITDRGTQWEGQAFGIRGKRIALLNNTVSSDRYSVWLGGTEPYISEDIIIAGNTMSADGDESTVRLVTARRTVVVDNVLTNGTAEGGLSKHNYRIHGNSELNYASRNIFIHSGVMIASMVEDTVGMNWLVNNTFYQLRPSLFGTTPENITNLDVSNNRIYSDSHSGCMVCIGSPSWESGNVFSSYRSAP